jgi:DNA topoisomerase-3
VRAAIESECARIAEGAADKDAVVRHTLRVFEAKFRFFAEHVEAMDELFQDTFSPLTESGRPFSTCGKCLRFMRLVQTGGFARLHCATCADTYRLPSDAVIKLASARCPLDRFELVLASYADSAKHEGRTLLLCPLCYSSPPFGAPAVPLSAGGAVCATCAPPACAFSLVTNAVCPCPANVATDRTDRPDRGRGRGRDRGRGGERGVGEDRGE